MPSFSDMCKPVRITAGSAKVSDSFDSTPSANTVLRGHGYSICGLIAQYGMIVVGAILLLLAGIYICKSM